VSPFPLITTGNCPPGGSASFNIQLQAGFSVACRVISQTPGYLPTLQVFDANGVAIGTSTPIAGGTQVFQFLSVPTTGIYRVQVGTTSPSVGGNFSLTVQ
jgi:hypothetical protein